MFDLYMQEAYKYKGYTTVIAIPYTTVQSICHCSPDSFKLN